MIATFLGRYPQTEIDLIVADKALNLIEARIDLAIRVSNEIEPSLIAKQIGTAKSIIVATPDYLALHGEPQHIEDLAQHSLLAASAQIEWRVDGPGGPVTLRPHGVLQTNSSEVVREAVVSGLGIGLRSTWDVSEELKSGVLKRILPAYAGSDKVSIYAIYPSRRLVPPKVRAFVDYLAELYGPEPYWDRNLAP